MLLFLRKGMLSDYHASHSITHLPMWHFQNLSSTFQYVLNPLSEFLSSCTMHACMCWVTGGRQLIPAERLVTETNPTTFMVLGEQKDLSY